MAASVPLIEIPLTFTVFPGPTFLLANVAVVLLVVKISPATRLSLSTTVAVVFPS